MTQVSEVVCGGVVSVVDITYVMDQLRHKPECAGWTEERFLAAERDYQAFLALCKQERDIRHAVPSADVDVVWHRHILNTRRYMADCEASFGYYFHHTPAEPGAQPSCDAGGCDGSASPPQVRLTCFDDGPVR